MNSHQTQYITASCIISKNTVYKNEKPVFENSPSDLAGFLLSAYRFFDLQYPKFYKMDNLSKLGLLAAEVLLKPGFKAESYAPEAIGVVLSNASASLDTDLRYMETAREIASPALFVYTLPNIMTGEICIKHRFKGENAFFVSAGFDGEFLHGYVSGLMNDHILEACICGWVELFEQDYRAVLFLVENRPAETRETVRFTIENIYKIYQLDHGEINE